MRQISILYFLCINILLAIYFINLRQKIGYKYDKGWFISVLNIGNGDSTLIKTRGGLVVLIDAGPDASIISRLSGMLSPGVDSIDLLILTHSHADHIGGVRYLLDEYKVRCVIYRTDDRTNSSMEEDLRNRLIARSVDVYFPFDNDTSAFGSECVTILDTLSELKLFYYGDRYTTNQVKINQNLESLFVLYSVGDFNYWHMSDNEHSVQEQIYNSVMRMDTTNSLNVLKVPHQGSADSLYKQLIHYINPQVAIISVGINGYGHPHKNVVDFYRNRVPLLLSTKIDSDILIRKNRADITIQKRCFNNIFWCSITKY